MAGHRILGTTLLLLALLSWGQSYSSLDKPERAAEILNTIPPDAPRICAMHWGFFRPGIFLWAVPLPDGRLYIEREFTFIETVASDVAKAIVAINRLHKIKMGAGGFAWGNAPAKVKDDDIGEGTFETLYNNGVPVVESTHDPIAGWQRLQHWLEPMTIDGREQATLIVSPACRTVIATLPQLLQDDHQPEDVDDTGETHAAKALRYLVMSRPEPPTAPPLPDGRDLSKLDDRVRQEIEFLREIDQAEATDQAAAEYSMGEFWGA